jgi:hypothetical protein
MYAVRAKITDEGPALPEIRRLIDAISESDDDEEVQDARAAEPRRRKVSNVDNTVVDPTASPQHLRTVHVSSQLFLTSKRARGEQMELTPHAGWGIFGWPEQNRLCYDDPDIDSDPEGV